ncbi:MAG: hypothetical protein U9N42_03390 [Campylobacterota bacterium]|nr:hypothetical protein [Campylobacterota bacterium]
MFEFVNSSEVVPSVILVFVLLLLYDSKDKRNNSLIIVSMLILVAMNIYLPFNQKSITENNIEDFKSGNALICKVNDFTYKVSKKSSWSVEGYYFLKDDLLIRADSCSKD